MSNPIDQPELRSTVTTTVRQGNLAIKRVSDFRIESEKKNAAEARCDRKKLRPKLFLIGPTPPPFYGVAVATQRTFEKLSREEFDVERIDTSDRRTTLNFGRFDFGNITLALGNIIRLLTGLIRCAFLDSLARIQHGRLQSYSVVYVPISQAFPAYYRDALFILLGKIFGSRVVLHLRGGYFHEFYASSSPLKRWILETTVGSSDRVIVLGESLRHIFSDLVSPENIEVVSNGVSPLEFYPDEILRAERIARDDRVQVCLVSNLDKTKGWNSLLKAVVELNACSTTRSKFKVVIAGQWFNEADKIEAEKFIRHHQLGTVIEFVSPVSGEIKRRLLAESDIFCMPTNFKYEGQPWAIIEAMMTGLPIVTSPQGCIAETVVSGECGFVLPHDDIKQLAQSLSLLILDGELRCEFGRNARQRAENCYSEERFISSLTTALTF